jgi:hypothetical protein
MIDPKLIGELLLKEQGLLEQEKSSRELARGNRREKKEGWDWNWHMGI